MCVPKHAQTHTYNHAFQCSCVKKLCWNVLQCVAMSLVFALRWVTTTVAALTICASNRLCPRSSLLLLLLVISVYQACRKQCCNNTVAELQAFIVIVFFLVVALLNQVCLGKFLFDFIYATFYATLLCPSVRPFASRHMLPHPTHRQRLHLRMSICSHTHWYVRPPASDYRAVSTCLWVGLRLRCNYSTCNANKSKNPLK